MTNELPNQGLCYVLSEGLLLFEASADCECMTMEMASMNHTVGTVLKLIALSEGMTKDKMFARQVKRKFC